MPLRLFLTLCAFVLSSTVVVGQMSIAAGGAFHRLDDVNRWGMSGAVKIPLSGSAFELVPNFEYYWSAWSSGGDGHASDTSDVYVVSADLHINLPALVDRARPYLGGGVVYAGHNGEGALGLDLAAGLYARARGWKIFPFGQITYRVLPTFESGTSLETYYLRGGIRVVL